MFQLRQLQPKNFLKGSLVGWLLTLIAAAGIFVWQTRQGEHVLSYYFALLFLLNSLLWLFLHKDFPKIGLMLLAFIVMLELAEVGLLLLNTLLPVNS